MKSKWLAILLLSPLLFWAQQGKISCRVFSDAHKPLPYAQIFIHKLKTGITSDGQGYFTLSEIPFGSHKVEIQYIGCVPFDTIINLQQDSIYLGTIMLPSRSIPLADAEVNGQNKQRKVYAQLKNIEGVAIYAAKKNEVLELKNMTANLASNNARQVFARVPGVNVWESDDAGLQLGIGARGLSPNRTSNFNTRQNGYDMAADALGYPESYYSPPMQAIDRIEIVRGAASLQYGTQFGGMINLKLKQGDPNKKISGSSENTYNSMGYFNTFNDVGGQLGKLNYYGFINYRGGSGYRQNSDFDTYTAYLHLGYQFSERFSLVGEYTKMQYLAQQPGGLLDFQFKNDPYQSLRTRNWFSVDWNLMALTLNYDISDQTRINSRTFALLGNRKALGFLQTPNYIDFKPYVNRDLVVDYYHNIGNETRLLHHYSLHSKPAALLVGIRAYKGFTTKTQGYGSKKSDADFTFHTDSLNLKSDYSFPGYNLAAFAENIFNITDKLSITPGMRYEFISTKADGFYDSSVRIPNTGEVVIDSTTAETRERNRSILLAGIGLGYRFNNHLELYTNFSQNYRAITFNDMRVVSPASAVDSNLQDERGFNMDLGVRGTVGNVLTLDAGVFWLSYQNRIGTVLKKIEDEFFGERLVRYTTNVADAEVYGAEAFAELDLLNTFKISSPNWQWSLFTNLALTNAYYHHSEESSIENNRVEYVPLVNVKTGLQVGYKKLKTSFQYSYLSKQYSEATNAEASATGIYGVIPAYMVFDFSAEYSWKWMHLEGGVNNIANSAYFTRRATGYPGPGVIPSSPRNFYLGVGLRF